MEAELRCIGLEVRDDRRWRGLAREPAVRGNREACGNSRDDDNSENDQAPPPAPGADASRSCREKLGPQLDNGIRSCVHGRPPESRRRSARSPRETRARTASSLAPKRPASSAYSRPPATRPTTASR